VPASIRLSPELQEQLRSHAERHQLSASDVVREALAQYFAGQPSSPWELGAPLFGRYRSGDAPTQRSATRKALLRERIHRKHPRT
jgi:predicted DNA-binding protein